MRFPKDVEERGDALAKVFEGRFGKAQRSRRKGESGPVPDASDAEILRHLARMDCGAKFLALWNGDTSLHDSHSEADAALLHYLLWRNGGDVAQAHRLFGMSGLVRDKWTEREDYRERTTKYVLDKIAGDFYNPAHGEPKVNWGSGAAPPNQGTPESNGTATAADPKCAYSIILRFFTTDYQPTYRKGGAIFAASRGHLVKFEDAKRGAPIELINKLMEASDAPRNRAGQVDRDLLPSTFRTWCGSAWTDLVARLPDEEESVEIHVEAVEEFDRLLSAALNTLVTFAQDVKPDKPGARTEPLAPQRRSVLEWARMWAKPGPWKKIRSLAAWCKLDEEGKLRVALTTVFFSQVGAIELAKLTQNKFNRLCVTYGMAEDLPDNRVGGVRATTLTVEASTPLMDEVPKDHD